jgi:hypothetical protein
MDLLIKFNSGDMNITNTEKIKLLNDISDAINKKIKKLEADRGIRIKLNPLPTNLRGPGIPMTIATNAIVNTNVNGVIPIDTVLNVSPMLAMGPFVIDPSGPQINQRVATIKRYLEIIIVIRKQFEMFDKGELTKDQMVYDYYEFCK